MFVDSVVGVGSNPGLGIQIAVGVVGIALVVVAVACLRRATLGRVGIGGSLGQAVEDIVSETLLLVAVRPVQDGLDIPDFIIGIGQVLQGGAQRHRI